MDTNLKQIIANNLRTIRIRNGWSQAFVARQIGISIRSISRVENGYGISKKLLKKLCNFYRVDISCIYENQKKANNVRLNLIPDDVALRMLLENSFFYELQREAVLRFNDTIQKNVLMYREDVEELIPEVISMKKSFSVSEVISCCMAVNQKTLQKITQIAVL